MRYALALVSLVSVFTAVSAFADDQPAATVNVVGATVIADTIKTATLPVVVKFGADWCGWCQKFEPVLQQTAQEMKGKAIFLKGDTDQEPSFVKTYNLDGIPQTLVFINGVEKTRLVGYSDHDHFSAWLAEQLK